MLPAAVTIFCLAIVSISVTRSYRVSKMVQLLTFARLFRCLDVAKTRVAANDMTNSYLAGRLIGPTVVAKLLPFRISNPPPSKEGGEGDCARPM